MYTFDEIFVKSVISSKMSMLVELTIMVDRNDIFTYTSGISGL